MKTQLLNPDHFLNALFLKSSKYYHLRDFQVSIAVLLRTREQILLASLQPSILIRVKRGFHDLKKGYFLENDTHCQHPCEGLIPRYRQHAARIQPTNHPCFRNLSFWLRPVYIILQASYSNFHHPFFLFHNHLSYLPNIFQNHLLTL